MGSVAVMKIEDGRWRTENGEWRMENIICGKSVYCGEKVMRMEE
jgi:hypothetical protein